jgi:hypothetical protein
MFQIGYSNDFGTVLDDPGLLARVLGTTVYEVQRNWPTLKARWVDHVDTVADFAHYLGLDTPESFMLRHFPHVSFGGAR